MLKKRIIPILTFNGLALIKTKQFKQPRTLGSPIQFAKIFNSRNVDELVFVDIMATKQQRKINLKIAKSVIDECFMPVTIGGGIQTLQDVQDLFRIGADKVIIKNQALRKPNFIKEIVQNFGSQAIVIAVDVIYKQKQLVIGNTGNEKTKITAMDFIRNMEDLGAGELCITDICNDGMMTGFNVNIFSDLEKYTSLPIIANGGAGLPTHYSDLLKQSNITGIGGGSIFYFTQFTPFDIKYELHKNGFPVRIFDSHLKSVVNE